jgi:integrase
LGRLFVEAEIGKRWRRAGASGCSTSRINSPARGLQRGMLNRRLGALVHRVEGPKLGHGINVVVLRRAALSKMAWSIASAPSRREARAAANNSSLASAAYCATADGRTYRRGLSSLYLMTHSIFNQHRRVQPMSTLGLELLPEADTGINSFFEARSGDVKKRTRYAREARYLSTDETRRLVNACPQDFRRMVQAALLTGCRYSELTNLRCVDFHVTWS